MPFYTGKTADGSDMEEVEGMYLSPNGKEWSSVPYKYPYIQENEKFTDKEHRLYWEIYDYLNGKRSFRDEYNLILEKKSELSKAQRDYLIKQFEQK